MATQTGSIDLTASNGVKLMAEAGFESVEENYATKAELDVQADRIGMVVANNDASSSLQLTADAMTYIGNNVTIKGTDGTSTVISGGQIQTGSLSIGAFDSAAQSATLNSNISVGGRNLLTDSESMASWYKGPLATVNDGVVELAGTTSSWNAYIGSSKYDIGYYDGTTSYVWSFDYKSTADCLIAPVIASTAATVESSSWTRTKYTNWQANLTVPSTSGEWKRLVFNPRTISIEQLASGSGNAVSGYLQIYARTNDVTISVRHMKLERGNKATDWTPAPEDVTAYTDDAIDSIEVGGRNIAKASDAVVTPATYKALTIYLSEHLEAEQTYVFQLWDVDVSHSAKSTAQLGVDVYYCGGNIKMSGWHGSAYFTNGHADHLQLILTPHSSAATDAEGGSESTKESISSASSVTNAYINLYNSVPSTSGTMNLTAGKWKLEKGNKATDWTPAPEDVDSAISDAAKTATSYVTEITSQNGIMVHPSTDDTTGVRITTDVDIMRDGNSVLNVGTQGDATSTDAGVTIYDGNGNDAENVVSDFTSDGVRFYDSGTVGMHVGSVAYNGATRYGLAGYDENGVLSGLLSVLSSGYMNVHGLAGSRISSGKVGASTTYATVDAEATGISERFYKAGDAESAPSFTRSITANGFYEGSHAGSNTWSTPAGTVLWSGTYYMTASHTATLAYNISTCPTGIVLHFQPYTSSTVQNYFHQYCFVPKTTSFGAVHNFTLCNSGFAKVGMKALRIYDNRIVGDDSNDDTGTASGITFDNKYWVMTQVIAV